MRVEGEFGQLVVIHVEHRARRVQDARGVDRACEGQEMPSAVGESGDRAAQVVDGLLTDRLPARPARAGPAARRRHHTGRRRHRTCRTHRAAPRAWAEPSGAGQRGPIHRRRASARRMHHRARRRRQRHGLARLGHGRGRRVRLAVASGRFGVRSPSKYGTRVMPPAPGCESRASLVSSS